MKSTATIVKTMLQELGTFVVLLLCLLAVNGRTQTFTNIHSFTATTGSAGYNGTNSDGGYSEATLILSGNSLYGVATSGGSAGWGTVFAVNTDGTGFTNLYGFSATAGYTNFQQLIFGTNSDGAVPTGGLVLTNKTLYGTTLGGGILGNGTVFAVNSDGTGFTNLHSFTVQTGPLHGNNDGANPYAGLVLSGNTLYGTAYYGGSSDRGTVFKVNTDGTGFTNLHGFTVTSGSAGAYGVGTNSDGAFPYAGLILSRNTLYGTADSGGSAGWGTVFAVNTDGTGFTNLHSFTVTSGSAGAFGYGTNSDGVFPLGGLILSGNTLYGTATGGGRWGYGTVFKINTDGTSLTILHSFTATSGSAGGYGTNSEGTFPIGGLILSGNTLYGTANVGGGSGYGAVFAVNTDGTGFTNLHSFTATSGSEGAYGTNSDGAYPRGGLVLTNNTLYGTASGGGKYGSGTVFSIKLPPPHLTINRAGANVVLEWPSGAGGFTLQSTTNLGSSAIWTTNCPAPVVISGQNVVTNPITASEVFFRLSR